ncbi:MAG: coenzyme F420-0:L-glutamate ligase [Hyphomicrobiales bacterium]|nr:coenzyme F420-0:L-glutamate ligase [Hyphomicrobiales bacterium]MBV9974898.1 coenzyme F420-0:L-glutamate ligase [Hyphomicrobiales bacterium]
MLEGAFRPGIVERGASRISRASRRRKHKRPILPVTITALEDIPLVQPGDDLAALLIDALARAGLTPLPFDILVIAQKIVSKAQGRFVELASLTPSQEAIELSEVSGKDSRLVQAILREAREVVRARRGLIIVETHEGLVMANAGIDQSNLSAADQGRRVLLLPENAQRSAEELKTKLDAHFGAAIGVIISDSVGRAFRLGTVGLAIGAVGVPALWDRRGEADLSGRRLEATEVGFADAVAAAAVLAMGEAAEGRPAALVRGLEWKAPSRPASALVRPKSEDLFR